MNENTEWVEIFGLSKNRSISDINPSEYLRIPNHTFIRIETEVD